MDLNHILAPGCTRHELPATSRKRTLELASDLLADEYPELDAAELFEGLVARERLGSTAVGEGVAIPHCRSVDCERPVAALLHLVEPVDFDAPDGSRVDLVFVLVVPEEADRTHLEILATAAGAFNEPSYRQALREAPSDPELWREAVAAPHGGDAGASAAHG